MPDTGENLVVALTADTMGRGDDALGKILIKAFIHTLTELPAPPKSVVFYNAGALLAAEGANTVDDLKRLEALGARLLICGTCANYYEMQDKIAVGSISNMPTIAETLAGASRLISI